jgi:hypothetical protein
VQKTFKKKLLADTIPYKSTRKTFLLFIRGLKHVVFERRDTTHKKRHSPHKKRTKHTKEISVFFLKSLENRELTTQKMNSAHKKRSKHAKKEFST